ncbi:MAG: hypothetical protein CMJ62_03465 [Planctomycetaceae bacterium]|nr:hypothetical protein [Planctomycetaceae bacterium]
MSRLRFKRAAISLSFVLTGYWTYSLFVVPWIEPQTKRMSSRQSSPHHGTVENSDTNPSNRFAHLFQKEAWELQQPKSLVSESATVFFRDYKMLEDQRLELTPCTIIIQPEEAAKPSDVKSQQPLVLQAPEGAILKFEHGLDLRNAKSGHLIGGQFSGPITLSKQETTPGGNDHLFIKTSGVTLTAEKVWTERRVEFRYGESSGSGQGLNIQLLSKSGNKQHDQPFAGVAGIQSIELARIDRFHLVKQPGSREPVSSGKIDYETRDLKKRSELDITCQGPFRFDFERLVASFEEQVDVVHLRTDGPGDQLSCHLLEIHFMDGFARQRENSGSARPVGLHVSADLQPESIKAWGHPMIVRSPTSDMEARCDRLEYHIENRRVRLFGKDGMTVRHTVNWVETTELEYELQPAGRLGRLWVAGPGKFRSQVGDGKTRPALASWKKELYLRPEGKQHVLSLLGGALIQLQETGSVTADEIHCWLQEHQEHVDHQVSSVQEMEQEAAERRSLAGSTQTTVEPSRLLARHRVTIESPQLTGQSSELVVWITKGQDHDASSLPESQISSSTRTSTKLSADVKQSQRFGNVIGRPAASKGATDSLSTENVSLTASANAPTHSLLGTVRPQSESLSKQRAVNSKSTTGSRDARDSRFQRQYHLQGKQIRLDLQTDAGWSHPMVRNVAVDGEAHLSEKSKTTSHHGGLIVNGETLEMRNANSSRAEFVVTGTPCTIQSQGLAMSGKRVFLNQFTNQMRIDGPGWLTLPLERDLDGQPLAHPEKIRTTWQRRMKFDGAQIHFEGEVDVRATNRRITSDLLVVTLSRRIDFTAEVSRDTGDLLRRVDFTGHVRVENRTYKESQLVSVDRLHLGFLSMDHRTGKILGTGPGEVSTIRTGQSGSMLWARSPGQLPGREPDANGLFLINVAFQKAMQGNFHQRQIHFEDEVVTVYGPVDHWEQKLDPDFPQQLGPRGFVLNCNRLSFFDMRRENSKTSGYELFATGNSTVEGETFFARSQSITYATAKEQLILEGGSRSAAVLWYRQHASSAANRIPARKIIYWPRIKKYEVLDVGTPTLQSF